MYRPSAYVSSSCGAVCAVGRDELINASAGNSFPAAVEWRACCQHILSDIHATTHIFDRTALFKYVL
jgi:hypothetical protein